MDNVLKSLAQRISELSISESAARKKDVFYIRFNEVEKSTVKELCEQIYEETELTAFKTHDIKRKMLPLKRSELEVLQEFTMRYGFKIPALDDGKPKIRPLSFREKALLREQASQFGGVKRLELLLKKSDKVECSDSFRGLEMIKGREL